jgi:hypothetical protein
MIRSKVILVLAAALATSAALSGCAGGGRFVAPDPIPDDRRNIPEPEGREINARGLRWMTGSRKEAMNVDALDEVPNSSWFTNRNHLRPMSVDEIRRGPDTVGAPDQSAPWIIKRAKSQGVTPGFHIVDRNDQRYLIKFDPKDHPELITGAEVVSTKLFYAAGYHTPENHVVYFDPADLRVGDEVKFTDEKGKKRLMREDDLRRILEKVRVSPDGKIRAVASKYVAGNPIGPFKYSSTRDDDPNDIIPHQHRRELRGLRVIAAWIGHFDTKAGNSLDAFVEDGGRGYVRHYLIDFGSTLGAGAEGPVPKFRGHENDVDPHALAQNVLTLGLWVRPYEKLGAPPHPSVGLWESDLFEPQEYKFLTPNPAFENMTDRDGYWGAKIVMSFTDEQIDAAVEEARYSHPDAAAHIARVIKERRDKVGRHWFARVNPLDRFEITSGTSGIELSFADLAVDTGLERAADTNYRFTLDRDGRPAVEHEPFTGTTISITPAMLGDTSGSKQPTQWACSIETKRGDGSWSDPVRVYLEPRAGEVSIYGVRR